MKKIVWINVLILFLAISFYCLGYSDAKNPAKKSYVAKYPQCQVLLEKYHTIKNEINAMPAGQVRSERVQEKVAAWKEYKTCVKQQKKVDKQAKDFNSMQPADQTELQQQLDTVRPQ